MLANPALHADAPASLRDAGVPSLASSLGAGERGRWADKRLFEGVTMSSLNSDLWSLRLGPVASAGPERGIGERDGNSQPEGTDRDAADSRRSRRRRARGAARRRSHAAGQTDRRPALAADLVWLKVDVIVTA